MELQTLLDGIDKACKNNGLHINADKPKVVTTAEATCIRCDNSVLEQVDTHSFIHSLQAFI